MSHQERLARSGRRLAEAIAAAGHTQTSFAAKLGVSISTLNTIVRGRRPVPAEWYGVIWAQLFKRPCEIDPWLDPTGEGAARDT